MLLKLAWRNIWRNKSRTFITLAAVSVAVILSSLMTSVKDGVLDSMVESMIGNYSGYVQIHAKGYWDEKTIDNSLLFSNKIGEKINEAKFVKGFSPRIESFALSVSDSASKGTMLIGINTEKEKAFNQLNERVIKGEYLSPDDKSVLIGSGLAEFLKVDINDTLVLLSQGYHGSSATGKYYVKGVVKFGSPELSKQLIFLPMKEAQWFYGVESMYTNIVVHITNINKAVVVGDNLSIQLGKDYEAMDWKELSPELVNLIKTENTEGYVFMFILYMVISFGLFGTMLMMLSERKHEFGVLVAIGMKRIKLALMVWLELAIISLMGAFIGTVLSYPICAYYHYNPIQLGDEIGKIYEDFGIEAVLQFSINPQIFITQGIIILIISSIIAIYPFIKLQNLDAIKQMRA